MIIWQFGARTRVGNVVPFILVLGRTNNSNSFANGVGVPKSGTYAPVSGTYGANRPPARVGSAKAGGCPTDCVRIPTESKTLVSGTTDQSKTLVPTGRLEPEFYSRACGRLLY